MLPDDRPTATGRDRVRRLYEGTFEAIGFQRELHIDATSEDADVTVARTHTTGTLTLIPAGDTIPLDSRELFVLRRTGTDRQITEYMFNRPGTS